eukprot:m.331476 g.331476  ORF g.331476 m.331476 type:complete len:346 (-) comp20479_c0_seq1:716-1753(-)
MFSLVAIACSALSTNPPVWVNGSAVLANGTVAIPVGVYVMFGPTTGFPHLGGGSRGPTDAELDILAASTHVHGVGLHISWSDLQPTANSEISAASIASLAARLDHACELQGRVDCPHIFPKLYMSELPDWAFSDPSWSTLPSPGVPAVRQNKLLRNMTVISYVDPASTAVSNISHVPVATDAAYHDILHDLFGCIARWVGDYDPSGTRVSMLHAVGPAMTSVQMRIPDGLEEFFPNQGADLLGLGWSKEKHIQAWTSTITSIMTDSATAHVTSTRCWVFDYTNLPVPSGVSVSLQPKITAPAKDPHSAHTEPIHRRTRGWVSLLPTRPACLMLFGVCTHGRRWPW